MYRELQRDMGPYRAVHITLYMFTHVLQVNMCFLYVQTRRKQILLRKPYANVVHVIKNAVHTKMQERDYFST